MKKVKQAIAVLSLSFGLIAFVPATFAAAGSHGGWADRGRDRDYSELRNVVDRTQSDLRNASDLEHGNKQRDRYHDAQDNLSKFDRSLSRGKFDKGALEHSIDGLKKILDHNTLQATARDALERDVSDLKIARDRRN